MRAASGQLSRTCSASAPPWENPPSTTRLGANPRDSAWRSIACTADTAAFRPRGCGKTAVREPQSSRWEWERMSVQQTNRELFVRVRAAVRVLRMRACATTCSGSSWSTGM